jgi:hypothetical protein
VKTGGASGSREGAPSWRESVSGCVARASTLHVPCRDASAAEPKTASRALIPTWSSCPTEPFSVLLTAPKRVSIVPHPCPSSCVDEQRFSNTLNQTVLNEPNTLKIDAFMLQWTSARKLVGLISHLTVEGDSIPVAPHRPQGQRLRTPPILQVLLSGVDEFVLSQSGFAALLTRAFCS